MNEYNPFAAPSAYGDFATENIPRRQYGGIGRGACFGLSFLMNIIVQVVYITVQVVTLPGVGANTPVLDFSVVLVTYVGGFAIAYQRCKNIGMNPWWCLLLIVPILNIFVGLRCLAYPEGYEDHKTLDGPAKVIIGLLLALFLFAVIAIVAVIATIGR